MKHSPGFLRLVEEVKREIREIRVEEVMDRLARGEPMLLLDVREESEWRRGHLPQAQHLCKGVIERDIEALCPDLDAQIVLYCGGGYRSALAAANLQKMGYRRVASMAGGWREWVEKGLPVEGGEERQP
jgi:rhodanese-related sulfurtransferase